jgi:cyclopropane fatty-acyl-phospholipid synthase-like methyltransferase
MLYFHNASSVLEVGCGAGYLLPYMICKKRKEAKLYAVDLSEEMLTRASLRLEKFLHEKPGSLDDIIFDKTKMVEVASFDEVNT